MAAYSQFLGSRVSVQYRVGDILLSASGVFVGDSGRSIFLEQHLEQRGKRNYFRWEIPYPNIHRIEAAPEADTAEPSPTLPEHDKAAAATAGTRGSAATGSAFLPLSNKPNVA